MIKNSFKGNINTIKEIYPGVFQIILDFASNRFIKFALRDNYEFIWIHSYEPKNRSSWTEYDLPISEKLQMKVLARQITYDFVIKTIDYEKIKNEIPNGMTLIQTNKLPPDFLDLKRLEGKTRYDLLKKECDFLFEIDLPSAVDYGTLVSTSKNYLIDLLNDKNIDWTNLP
jgi:hypothetical protein